MHPYLSISAKLDATKIIIQTLKKTVTRYIYSHRAISHQIYRFLLQSKYLVGQECVQIKYAYGSVYTYIAKYVVCDSLQMT